jgi:glycogen phosphorylase
LGGLNPEDIQVELYKGTIDASGEIAAGNSVVMDYQGKDPGRSPLSLYSLNIAYESSGLQGFSLRVMPKHKNLTSPYETGLTLWA